MDVVVRDAEPGDAQAIADIYNPYVTGSVATFHTEPVDEAERLQWLIGHDALHPVLVAVCDEEVVGWGSLTQWASRPAWRRTVEVSTYVSLEHRGEGIGRLLMDALIERASGAGHHVVMAQVVAGNEASLAMGERSGFERVGLLKEVGHKFGAYHDIVLLQRILP
ncbi:MAG: GNAT family N-acetyltransferase [Coriobacteriia bacterium]|nr:GNAT family N-acetyltransferase [Coriobacteriia bacterium]